MSGPDTTARTIAAWLRRCADPRWTAADFADAIEGGAWVGAEILAVPVERTKTCVYLAAPVSPDIAKIDADLARTNYSVVATRQLRAQVIAAEIALNLARARRWLRWLVEHTDWSINATWIAGVQAAMEAGVSEADERPRGLADMLVQVERCDAIVLVGGRVSGGMAMERDHAVKHGLTVIDLTKFGEEPGALKEADAGQIEAALREGWSDFTTHRGGKRV